MKIWVETRTVDYPEGTVSGRFGASLLFVGYEPLLKQWLWLQPKGVVERIAEPPQIFMEEEWVRQHTLPVPRPKLDVDPKLRGKNKHEQFALEL